jgi:hypothetical protein
MKPCPKCGKAIPDGAWACGCGWREYRDIEAIEHEMYGCGDNPTVAAIRAKLRQAPPPREPGADEQIE